MLIYPWLLHNYSLHQRQQEQAHLQRFVKDADAFLNASLPYLTDDPARRHSAGAMLRYAGEVLLGRRVRRPVIFLVAARRGDLADHFTRQLSSLLSKHSLWQGELDLGERANREIGWEEFERRVHERLDQHRVLMLKGIDNLKSTAPLLLQSVSDPDSSPYMDKGVLIVATLHLPNPNKGTDCNTQISE